MQLTCRAGRGGPDSAGPPRPSGRGKILFEQPVPRLAPSRLPSDRKRCSAPLPRPARPGRRVQAAGETLPGPSHLRPRPRRGCIRCGVLHGRVGARHATHARRRSGFRCRLQPVLLWLPRCCLVLLPHFVPFFPNRKIGTVPLWSVGGAPPVQVRRVPGRPRLPGSTKTTSGNGTDLMMSPVADCGCPARGGLAQGTWSTRRRPDEPSILKRWFFLPGGSPEGASVHVH